MTFTWWDAELDYCTDDYNTAALNERAVEIPIASHFADQQHGDGLEVGRVLGHHRPVNWTVLDRYEPGAVNADVFDWNQPADWIVSVSTLEHIRWDEEPREPDGAERALRHLLGLLRPGGRMLVTVPFGYHGHLDRAIITGKLPNLKRSCSLIRSGAGWRQTDKITPLAYALTTPWAESVWIGEFAKRARKTT